MSQHSSTCTAEVDAVNARVGAPTPNAGKLVAWLFGFAAVLLFALTWSEDMTGLQEMARGYALPVVGIELLIIFISFREGIRLSRPRPLEFALLAALALLVWTTALTADSPATSLLRTGIWTVHFFFGLAIVNLCRLGLFDYEEHVRAILCGFLVFFVMLFVFVATTDQSAEERVFGLPAFSHVRWFGYYAAGVIALSVPGLIRGNRFALFAASMAFAMAFWTGTRGTVAAATVGFAAYVLLFREVRSLRAWLLFAACGLAGLVIAFGLDVLAPIGDFGPDSMRRYGDSGRVEVWRATIDLIQARPWFGHGDGQFSLLVGESLTIAQPHNIVLQVLHAWGIVGALLCLALAIRIAPSFLQSGPPHNAGFLCGALVLGAYSFIDGALFYNQSLALFALCCAAAIAPGLSAERRQDSETGAVAAAAL